MTVHDAPTSRQLRTRPIDLTKKLPIIRTIEDLNKYIGDDHNSRVDPYTLGFRSNNSYFIEDIKQRHYQKKKNIVIPPVAIKESCNITFKPFTQPDYYIRYEIKKDYISVMILDDGSITHYDILKEDEEFLNKLQKQRTSNHSNKAVLTEINFCKLIDCFEKSSGVWGEGPGEVNFDEALRIKKDLKIEVPSQIIKELHNYWKQRRLILGRPLIRIFWAPTSPHDTSPFAVFRPRIKDKMNLRRPKRNKFETIKKLESSLEEFKKIEKIIKKMKQRDEKKLSLLELNELLFEQMRHEIFDPFYKVPQWEFLKEKKFNKTSKKSKKEQDKLFVQQLNKLGITYPSPLSINRMTTLPQASTQTVLASQKESSETTLSPISMTGRFQLRIIRRKGRGGRIWIDRKQFYSKQSYSFNSSFHEQDFNNSINMNDNFSNQESSSQLQYTSPSIDTNITSFDIYNDYNYIEQQACHENILDALIDYEDETQTTDKFTLHSGIEKEENSSEPMENSSILNRPPKDEWESLQNFRAWLRYSLAPPPSKHTDIRPTPSRSVVIPVKPESFSYIG